MSAATSMSVRKLALGLSFSVGLLSLSQEIFWVRFVGFGQQGRPQAFAIVLAAFLIGISLGAIVGRRICGRSPDLLAAAARALGWAAALDLMALQLMAPLLGESPERLAFLMLMIAVTAGAKGVLFPIVHHLGSNDSEAGLGSSVSKVYLANVMGSALGPLLAGFWLLDLLRVEAAWALVAAATASLSLLTLLRVRPRQASWFAMPVLLLLLGAALVARPLEVIEKVAEGEGELVHQIQNKHGILHVTAGGATGDVTYGGNAYDGRINVNMAINSNGLDRAYLMAVLHPQPKRVLVIGLSTGAWTAAILGFPGVEQVDVVEINPGYRELISRHPAVAGVLADPRVRVHIDDGRRWLRAHADQRYDLIFQNTTFHWRAYAAMLLSREYLQETQRHLNPGGIVAMNTTDSPDAYATAQAVFGHVARYSNFAYMSDSPLQRHDQAEAVLRACRTGGGATFAERAFTKPEVAWRLLNQPLRPAADYLAGLRAAEPPGVITDLNLLNEYRHGKPPLFGALAPILPPWYVK
ncbi:fused MFS/spermidine synthase [Pelomonas sp. SE-A7]|uniref:fused MFS/spermidine synthase n=1 Tax=Pelomonas sp. SE-A7 TaxID=3054953 RepID=UPI00259CA9AD|nr:fused MFS/spermidine synthase [Pelomonas sp. SE-A7]MDM4768314.1 fused MFS/spermidine synthase [Pelomonas sp. SE-A7]